MLNSYGHFIFFYSFLFLIIFLSINCYALLIIFACKTEKDFRGLRFFIGGPYLMEQSVPSYPSCGQF